MCDIVPMGIPGNGLVICGTDGYTSEAGLAGAIVRAVRTLFVIKHQIP